MPAEHGLVGTGRAACQAHTECPLKRWQLSAQSPLCSLWPCLLLQFPCQALGWGN